MTAMVHGLLQLVRHEGRSQPCPAPERTGCVGARSQSNLTGDQPAPAFGRMIWILQHLSPWLAVSRCLAHVYFVKAFAGTRWRRP
jgi:hypothetical protein